MRHRCLVPLLLSLGPAAAGAPAPVTFPVDPGAPEWAQPAVFSDPPLPEAGVPARICAEVVNEDPLNPWGVFVEFAVAPLGMAVEFTIVTDTSRTLPPGEAALVCQPWLPGSDGPVSLRARLIVPGFDEAYTQRRVDASRDLEPGVAGATVFSVGNPFEGTVTISLGLVPRLPDWGLSLDADVFVDVPPGGVRTTVLRVTPPASGLPAPGTEIVDVEAYVGPLVLGGFRRSFGTAPPPRAVPAVPFAACVAFGSALSMLAAHHVRRRRRGAVPTGRSEGEAPP